MSRERLPDVESVADAVHESWMESKRLQGVTSRKSESGEELMVPYSQLSDAAKSLDRVTVQTVYAAIRASLVSTGAAKPEQSDKDDSAIIALRELADPVKSPGLSAEARQIAIDAVKRIDAAKPAPNTKKEIDNAKQ